MNSPLLAGLDIGTTGCKVTVYRPDGTSLGRVYRDYPASRTASEHEVDAGLIWQAVQEVLAEAAQKHPGLSGIGVTSFGESFVLLDDADTPLQNVMLYTDPRGEEECARLCEALGRDHLANITGLNPHSMYSIGKLMWIKEHRPERWSRTRRVCLMEDYIVYNLTGVAQIDYALASRTMAFDIRSLRWSQEILDAAGILEALLSRPVPTGHSAGAMKPALTARLGLAGEPLVLSCGHDQVAAAVGSGVFDDGTAVDGAGTVECITPVFTGIPENNNLIQGSYAIVPYVEPGKYVCYAFSFTGGALVKWFTETLAGYAATSASQRGVSLYHELEGTTPLDEPTGLLVLPHFAGAATPYMDTGSKGAILGLTLATTQQELHLGIMEGVCYEMQVNLNRLTQAGLNVRSLRATGGGANSRVWLQMKADVLGVPVTALASAEAGGMGSAMMAAVGLGLYGDLREAARAMVKERETYYPRQAVHEKYQEYFAKYERLYDAVRPLV